MIVEKRGKWLVYNEQGIYTKYTTKEEAEKAAGMLPIAEVEELDHASEENDKEEEYSEEEGLPFEESGSEWLQ